MHKAILIFGAAVLQRSLIDCCRIKGLFLVGIDPDPNALCKDLLDAFEVVDGQDYEKTLAVAVKYNVRGLITSATDKPLLMMARIAKKLALPFYSIQTAEWSTDKLLMKEQFQHAQIPCAKGLSINHLTTENLALEYPIIVKPRDNSGSRGVIYCEDRQALNAAVVEAFQFTKKTEILLEEFIDGQEYSVESIHINGKTKIIQITEKITTKFPYNVELGHIQPASLSEADKNTISVLLEKIGACLGFEHCASHTELKLSSSGVKIIETSPRLGGDFITSKLVPLSTGISLEDILIDISLGNEIDDTRFEPFFDKSSAIIYTQLPEGEIISLGNLESVKQVKGVVDFSFDLKVGQRVGKITSSLNRYGYVIIQQPNFQSTQEVVNSVKSCINENIVVK